MRLKELFNRLIKNPSAPQIGCLGIFSFVFFLIAIVGFVSPLIKIIFCSMFGIRCIDDKTGETISIPWSAIGVLVGFGVLLIIIDILYHRLKK